MKRRIMSLVLAAAIILSAISGAFAADSLDMGGSIAGLVAYESNYYNFRQDSW